MAEAAPKIRVGILPYRIHYNRRDAGDAYEFLPAANAATFTEADFVEMLHSELERRPNEEALVVFNLSGRADGWKTSSRWVSAADNIHYFINKKNYDEIATKSSPIDAEEALGTLSGAIVYFRDRGQPAGGCHPSDLTGRNDCLWRAIATAYGGPDRMPKIIETDKKLRKLVGRAYGELIPGEAIPVIEAAIKSAAIVCRGAYSYDSGESQRRDRVINLELAGSHYYLRTSGEKAEEFLDFDHKLKFPHVYVQRGDQVDIYHYPFAIDGQVAVLLKTVPAAEFRDIRHRKFDYPAWLIRCEKGMTPTESFQLWHRQRADMKLAGIDMAKYGKFTTTCRALHRLICRTIPRSEPVNGVELGIMNEAFHSGLMWGSDWSGPAVYLDVNSYYASLMNSRAMFPTRSGTLTTQTQPSSKFGYYYATVTGVPAAFFRGNPNGPTWYTHTDLALVAKFGGTVELMQGQPNAYTYERDSLHTFNALYGGYVDRLFKLKLAGNRTAKQALTAIWGLHCAKSRRETVAHPDEDVFIDGEVTAMTPGEKTILITSTDPDLPYVGEHPRVGPFLTALGRSKMATMLAPHVDRLVSVLCDGFALSGDDIPADLATKVGTDLGQLKVENRGTVHVSGCVVRWE